MAITTISTLSNTDTITTLKDRTNSIINKVNTIDLDTQNLTLLDQASDPADNSLSDGSFVLYMDETTADVFVKIKNASGTVRRYRIVDYSAANNDVTYVA
tara:strand:+ start:908 stop:1207 length:300 start_codon:yes stop_codon:yes gene_type:complete